MRDLKQGQLKTKERTVTRRMLVVFLLLCAVCMLTACGSGKSETKKTDDGEKNAKPVTESRTVQLAEHLDSEKPIHLDITVTEVDGTKQPRIEVCRSGNRYYMKTKDGDTNIIVIADRKKKEVYYLLPDTKQGVKYNTIDQDAKAALKTSVKKITGVFWILNSVAVKDIAWKWTEEKEKIDDKIYQIEVFKAGSRQISFAYTSKGKLAYIINKGADGDQTVQIHTLSNKVDSAVFRVPDGYDITEQ